MFIFSTVYKNFLKELIIIDIEIKERNRIKEFFHKLHSKLEDMIFSIIQILPDKIIPNFLMVWLDRYTTNRINELKQQSIMQTWSKMYLEDALNQISDQHINKTPSED